MKADPHKDGIASLIVSIGSKAGKKGAEEAPEESGEPGDLELAMQELGERMVAKDYKGAAAAFSAANELCGYGSSEDDDNAD